MALHQSLNYEWSMFNTLLKKAAANSLEEIKTKPKFPWITQDILAKIQLRQELRAAGKIEEEKGLSKQIIKEARQARRVRPRPNMQQRVWAEVCAGGIWKDSHNHE